LASATFLGDQRFLVVRHLNLNLEPRRPN
jgi:hypothetical protein